MLVKWKYEMNVLWCGPKKEASEASLSFDETVVRQPTSGCFLRGKEGEEMGKTPWSGFGCCNPQAVGFWAE